MSTEAGTALGSLIGADRAGVVCARKFDEVRLVCWLWVGGLTGFSRRHDFTDGGGGSCGRKV